MKAIQKLFALPVLALAAGLCCVISLPSPAHAGPTTSPSFDCSEASTPQERLVCGDDELARLDVAMMQAFRMARDSAPDRQVVIDGQRAWLRNSFRTCSDKACLTSAYRSRITNLSSNRPTTPSYYNLAMKCAAAASFRGGVMKARGNAGSEIYLTTARVMGYAVAISGRKSGMTYDAAIDQNKITTDAYRREFEAAGKAGNASVTAFMTRYDSIESDCAAKMKAPGNFKSLVDLAFRVNDNQINLDQAAALFRPM
jgi:uncharacterized protein